MSSSANGSKTNNEALLLRKIASFSAPTAAVRPSRCNFTKLRKNLERQVRNSNEDQSLQVFLRLMKASHFLENDDDFTEDKRPVAPPTSPVPHTCRHDNDNIFKTTSPRHSSTRTAVTTSRFDPPTYSTLPSTVIVNSWMDGDSPEAWMVMKGRSIRLQHQDHVKNALIIPRQVQSATSSPHKGISHRELKDLSLRSKHPNGTPLPLSGRASRAMDRNLFSPLRNSKSCIPSYCTNNTSNRVATREQNGITSRENIGSSSSAVSATELNKSIVIRIPHLTKFSR